MGWRGGGEEFGNLSRAVLFSEGEDEEFFLLQKKIFHNSFVPATVLNHYTAEIWFHLKPTYENNQHIGRN